VVGQDVQEQPINDGEAEPGSNRPEHDSQNATPARRIHPADGAKSGANPKPLRQEQQGKNCDEEQET
jgi:hypothetical protein